MIYTDDIDFIVENDNAVKSYINIRKLFRNGTLDATCLKQKSPISKKAKMNLVDTRKNLVLC